jgi:hypothetical protein
MYEQAASAFDADQNASKCVLDPQVITITPEISCIPSGLALEEDQTGVRRTAV